MCPNGYQGTDETEIPRVVWLEFIPHQDLIIASALRVKKDCTRSLAWMEHTTNSVQSFKKIKSSI